MPIRIPDCLPDNIERRIRLFAGFTARRQTAPLLPVMAVCLAVALDFQVLSIHLYQDGAVLIRTQQLAADSLVAFHHLCLGMAEAVTVASGEYRVLRLHRGDKCG